MASGGFTLTEDTLTPSIKRLPDAVGRAVQMVMRVNEPQAENWMKTHARWSDRTTNARNGLAARYLSAKETHTLVLFHQVEYGIWLEVRWDGKYAIIDPALREFGPKVMKDLNGLLSQIHP